MKKLLIIIIIIISFGLYHYIDYLSLVSSSPNDIQSTNIETSKYQEKEIVYSNVKHTKNNAIVSAFEQHLNDIQVEGTGIVARILNDDMTGHKHQKFILRLSSGHTLLIAHNIDLAPRINNLSIGDTVDFFGEYVWNNKGGLIHWTHHDPAGYHITGWLKHNNRKYQ